jgi:hypothetical protein
MLSARYARRGRGRSRRRSCSPSAETPAAFRPRARRCASVSSTSGVHRSDRRSQIGKLTTRSAVPALGAVRSSALGLSQAQPRPRRLSGAQGADVTRARVAYDRALARRCVHTLRELGPAGIAPPASWAAARSGGDARPKTAGQRRTNCLGVNQPPNISQTKRWRNAPSGPRKTPTPCPTNEALRAPCAKPSALSPEGTPHQRSAPEGAMPSGAEQPGSKEAVG